jgi:hypothetical protein
MNYRASDWLVLIRPLVAGFEPTPDSEQRPAFRPYNDSTDIFL